MLALFIRKGFYPSIKQTLLKNAIQFAAGQTDINQNDFEVILHARKYLLFHSNQPLVKRDSDTFNVTAGAYDAGEICELVEIFTLSLINKISEHNIL